MLHLVPMLLDFVVRVRGPKILDFEILHLLQIIFFAMILHFRSEVGLVSLRWFGAKERVMFGFAISTKKFALAIPEVVSLPQTAKAFLARCQMGLPLLRGHLLESVAIPIQMLLFANRASWDHHWLGLESFILSPDLLRIVRLLVGDGKSFGVASNRGPGR